MLVAERPLNGARRVIRYVCQSMDLVSIVIPCYNPQPFLLDTLASARAQSHSNIEIILVNDGSDRSDSVPIIERASREADLFLALPHAGLAATRNAGFRAARGRYVAALDADDLIEPEFIAECAAALDSSPGAAFAYTDLRVFGRRDYTERLPEYNLYHLLDRNIVCGAAVIRKEAWAEAGGYDDSMRLGYEDWELWLRLGARHRFGRRIPKPLFLYRRQGPSLFDAALAHHAELTGQIREKHPELYGHDARARVKARWAPSVRIVSPRPPGFQTIQDIETADSPEQAVPGIPAPAVLVSETGELGPHSAEWAALAVWGGGDALALPDGSTAFSRRAARNLRRGQTSAPRPASPPAGAPGSWSLHRRLVDAGLLRWESWAKHPLQSASRLIPLRLKERVNRAAGRPLFDLSFYLQFQPNSVLLGNAVVRLLEYSPRAAAGRKRVAFLIPHLGPGGAESVLLDIAATLPRSRYELLVIATRSNDSRWLARWRSHAEHVYDLAALLPSGAMAGGICSIVANWKCDAVVTQNSLHGYAALPALKRVAPDVSTMDIIHAVDPEWDQIAATAGVAACLDLRVAVSAAVQDRLLASGAPPGQVKLIRAGIDLDRFRPASRQGPSAMKRILFAGRLDPVKRPLLLADIAVHLSASRKSPDFLFVVAGDGPESKRLRERIRRKGVERLFELRGHVEDLAPLFDSADVVLIPSRAEGVPLVLLEAFAAARPVVAANVGSIPEALDSHCGVLVDPGPGEAAAFAAALDELLERPDLRRTMGMEGRKRVEAMYNLDRTRGAYLELLDALVDLKPPAGPGRN